ncbi:cyclic nucleotide-binding-like protein [Zopfochytrium polystomum]|nr:cyclic nucleotide-binding-like protein [Zopfochytrium polystomum]
MLRQLSLGLCCVAFSAGETVYSEGIPGGEMFLLIEGIAAVFVGTHRLGFLTPGTQFGEMALIAPGPRVETVVAVTALSCMVLDRSAIQSVVDDVPEIATRLMELKRKHMQAPEFTVSEITKLGTRGGGQQLSDHSHN